MKDPRASTGWFWVIAIASGLLGAVTAGLLLDLEPWAVALIGVCTAAANLAVSEAAQRAGYLGRAPNRTSPRSASGAALRDRMLGMIADSVPDAVVLFSGAGTIHYSNPIARELFFEGQIPEGQNFIRLVSAAAAPLREALLGETDRFFSVDIEGRQESYHLSRRTFVVEDE